MSRLAKKPLPIPKGVTCNLQGSTLSIQGSKGKIDFVVPSTVTIDVQENALVFRSTVSEGKEFAQWGLSWALVKSKMTGVSEGFSKKLEIQWVGYRVEIAGTKLTLSVGFSHKVHFTIPANISVTPDAQNPNIITIAGHDSEAVGQFAAKIRATKTPEPYKGKGIRYSDEYVRRKAGKTAAK